MSGLLVGAVLTIVCLAYVFSPLIAARSPSLRVGDIARPRRPVTDDEIEAAIRSYRQDHVEGRACPMCGPRPEPDARFCSSCGRALDPTPRTA